MAVPSDEPCPSEVSGEPVPLVLVHGLWDTPALFDPLLAELGERRQPRLVPHLPHGLGSTPLLELAQQLDRRIQESFGPDLRLDLFGFSMGGVISRVWIQLLGGWRRTRRFTSVASPHRGSLMALPWPRVLLAGLDDMKPGSPLLRQLDQDLSPLRQIECSSFYCPTDLTVVPGWRAVLPVGGRHRLPGLRHDRLMVAPRNLEPLVRELLRP
ncbi:MAG: esterase/lipase family protein [Cyanobium sp.]